MRTGPLTTTTDRNLPVELADGVAERIPHRDRRRPYWRAEWWAQVPISKRGAQLRDTRDSERRDDFAPADKGGPGKALPESRSINANSQAIQGRGGGSVERESTGNLRNTIAQFGAQTRVGRKR